TARGAGSQEIPVSRSRSMSELPSPAGSDLPLVVHVGFAGSRRLFDAKAHPRIDADAFHASLVEHLVSRLAALRTDLGLAPEQFFCGISQVASGGDQAFARACALSGIPLRVYLPQTRDVYLSAQGSD